MIKAPGVLSSAHLKPSNRAGETKTVPEKITAEVPPSHSGPKVLSFVHLKPKGKPAPETTTPYLQQPIPAPRNTIEIQGGKTPAETLKNLARIPIDPNICAYSLKRASAGQQCRKTERSAGKSKAAEQTFGGKRCPMAGPPSEKKSRRRQFGNGHHGQSRPGQKPQREN